MVDSNGKELADTSTHVITQEELDAADAGLGEFDPKGEEAMKIYAKMRENNEGLRITPPSE